MLPPLIILDRDGVINRDSKDFIKSPGEWIAYEDSLVALRSLKEAGILVTVATNQSGVGRKLFDEAMLKKIHDKMHATVVQAGGAIDSIFYCPHLPENNCECRKPKPGLIWKIQKHYQADLKKTIVIGDSWRDIEAAIAANAIPILVKTGNGEKTSLENKEKLKNIKIFDNLLHAVRFILASGNIYNEI